MKHDITATTHELVKDGFIYLEDQEYVFDGNQRFVVLWHDRDAILVVLDTYQPFGCVMANIKFQNFDRDNDPDENLDIQFPSMGLMQKDLSAGQWFFRGEDGLKEIMNKINLMRSTGEFLNPWVNSEHIYVANFCEVYTTGTYLKNITYGRIMDYPEDVRTAINLQN